ncbi:peptidyl-prolyl cis-trans isomerase B (cyclophilin B) [Asanoa ishikariensis]|uniref:Peptidyl-prolyl cis-trans isomerase B (Cyclophilin B) n=1 Tax=Asanoa ishikariensis TaxID=137265 RepID=A0A1H3SDF3_9ACTN|nr:peptidylprolyl isomerase [Asanoa ishikariensis]SDZ35129.1 peptidyl-prolyl cis-trans isomerase B (cyclophilin B) [Asanoa ishikariensis]
MASSRDRQRKLARAKLDRQLARRAAGVRRKRRVQAGLGGALALVLIGLGAFWALGGFDKEPVNTATDVCVWTPQEPGVNVDAQDVGLPSATDVPTFGTRDMALTTNQGNITVELDLATAPCGSASLAYLAGKNFYDNTKCHEITTEGALHCGDPKGTNLGGPTYTFANENVPSNAPTPSPAPSPSASAAPGTPATYPAGTVALYPNPPGSNGSQFLIFFKDFTPTTEPAYAVVGKVSGGSDVLDKISKISTVDNGNGAKVKPSTDITIQTLTVGAVKSDPSDNAPTPSPANPSATPSATAPPTGAASGTPSNAS